MLATRSLSLRLAAALLLIPLGLSSCATPPGTKSPPQSLETKAGEEIQSEILSNFHVYTESDVNSYVSRVGQKISRFAKRQKLSYEFTILYDDRIYASSAPGGKVFLTTGLLAYLENEAELAGVLAHEIGELQYLDPALSAPKRMANRVQQGSALAAPFFGGIGVLAFLGISGITAATTMEKPKQKRVCEADKLALSYMVQAGYDPQGWLDFLYRLIDTPEKSTYLIMDYYWGRPISVERIRRLKAVFRRLSLEGESFSTNRTVYLETMKPVSELYKQ